MSDNAIFRLDDRLAADTITVGALALSRVLLMNDARYPWVILVPQRAALVEWSDLGVADRHLLLDEAVVVGEVISRLWEVDKINTASLGNMVAQLHVHVIGRRQGDPAWPGPVWGRGEAQPYEPDAQSTLVARLRKEFGCL